MAAALLLLGWSYTSSLAVLYAVWFLLGVCAGATFYDPAFTTIAVWFKQERSKAMLTITLVAGLASTIFVPLDTLLLEHLGWRGAVRVLALLMFLTAPLIWLVVRHRPSDVGTTVDGLPPENAVQVAQNEMPILDFWRSRAFWSVALAFALGRVAVSVLAPHLVPLLRERGYSSAFAATAAGAVGVLQLFGRVVFSSLTGRARLVLLSSATFLLHGLGVLFLIIPGDWGVWGFVLFYGATNGAITLTRAALLGELFAPNVYGRVNGTVSLMVSLSSAFTPFLAGVLHNRFGDYQVVLWGIVFTLLVSSVLVLNANAKARKINS